LKKKKKSVEIIVDLDEEVITNKEKTSGTRQALGN
jgi:hypothetical protein